MSADHAIALGLIGILSYLEVVACRRWPDSRKRNLGYFLALQMIAYAAVTYVQKGLTGDLDVSYALPLELCHWVMIACVFTLFHPNRPAAEIAYYWGLAGTLPAAVTPDIWQGFPSWEFVLFFWSHGGVLLTVVFLIAGQRFRPAPGSVWRAFAALNGYAAVVGCINWIFGWNYGYLCAKPLRPSLMDYLGPWPWYILSLEGVAVVSFFLLYLPWRRIRAR